MSKTDLMWSKAKTMKRAWLAGYRQSSYDVKIRYVDYDKETPHRETDYIEPKARSDLGNVRNLQAIQWQTSEKGESRMKRVAQVFGALDAIYKSLKVAGASQGMQIQILVNDERIRHA